MEIFMVYPQFIHTGFREAIVAHLEESGKQKKAHPRTIGLMSK
jgi:hypothetical protein